MGFGDYLPKMYHTSSGGSGGLEGAVEGGTGGGVPEGSGMGNAVAQSCAAQGITSRSGMLAEGQRMFGKAFTLIELLVVVSIIGVLVAITLPALSNARKTAKQTICLSQGKQQMLALSAYESDFKSLPYNFAQTGGDSSSLSQGPPFNKIVDLGQIVQYTATPSNPRMFFCPLVTDGYFSPDGPYVPAVPVYGIKAFVANQDCFVPEHYRGSNMGAASINLKSDLNPKPARTAVFAEDPRGVPQGPVGHTDRTGHEDNITVMYLDSHGRLYNKDLSTIDLFGAAVPSWLKLDSN